MSWQTIVPPSLSFLANGESSRYIRKQKLKETGWAETRQTAAFVCTLVSFFFLCGKRKGGERNKWMNIKIVHYSKVRHLDRKRRCQQRKLWPSMDTYPLSPLAHDGLLHKTPATTPNVQRATRNVRLFSKPDKNSILSRRSRCATLMPKSPIKTKEKSAVLFVLAGQACTNTRRL